jgi:hypothetical protein
LAIEQPSPSCHGVARPAAVSGLAGALSEQFIEVAACAAVWCVLMAAPVPSTGVVATSPSWAVAIAPLANESAGATVAVLVLALALAVGLELAVPDAEADAVPDADADADAVGWCRPNAESDTWTGPLFTAMTTPIATPAATGTAIAVAIRARRLLRER